MSGGVTPADSIELAAVVVTEHFDQTSHAEVLELLERAADRTGSRR